MISVNEKYRRSTVIVFLSALSLIFAALTVFSTDFFLAPAIGFLASLLLILNAKEKIPVFVCAAALCVLGYFVIGVMSVRALYCLVASLLLAFLFEKNIPKAEAAFYFVLLMSLFILADAYLSASIALQSFDFESVKNYYLDLSEFLRSIFSSLWAEAVSGYPALAEYDTLYGSDFSGLIFDTLVSLIPAGMFLVSFLVTGIAFKIFTSSARRVILSGNTAQRWRFLTSPLFAYVYAILLILNFFSSSFSDVLRISLTNLFLIFLIVYAYVGIRFLSGLLFRRRKLFFLFALYAGVVFLLIYAVEILSLVGVWVTVNSSRFADIPFPPKDGE